jgi:hypothetical protein
MISFENVEAMNAELYDYDVVQHGWEHENNGLEFNLKHTLSELVRAERKDFYDPTVIKEELAPDAFQYGLRIARWTRFNLDLCLPTQAITEKIYQVSNLQRIDPRVGAYSTAELLLADFDHKLDHDISKPGQASEREQAYQSRFDVLPRVSQALFYFAMRNAEGYCFNPITAFNDRLDNLRVRHNVGQTN